MRNKGVANDEEILTAAYHEVGHSLIAEALGLKIYMVMVARDASGYCETDKCTSPVQDLRLTSAGYVAECIIRGAVPTYEAMCLDMSQEDDADAIACTVMDGRVKGEIAVPKAMEFAKTYLEIPSVNRRLRRLAERLSRTRRLDGHIFNKEG